MNLTIFQFFHWYYSPEGNLWKHATAEAARLASLGVTHVWLPPAYKSAKGADEPGYAVYDLYDLGEFDQKGSVRTRYGTRDEYLKSIESFHQHNIQVIADIVLNHMMGADEKEKVLMQTVKEDNRLELVGEAHEAEAFTRFTFPGRKNKYSDYEWNKDCFTGICENGEINILHNQYTNGQWEELIDNENGNYDYLMGNDIEFRNPYVREELKRWGCWYVNTAGFDGFRLDALKHITPDFFPEWIEHLKTCFKKDFMVIGEFWKSDVGVLLKYLEVTGEKIQLFDVPLHHNFYTASRTGADYDMRTIFDGTLIKEKPYFAISFVDNHDTQPLQALESTVDYWFKPLAYALILLREQGIPCVFYPALYEARYIDTREEKEHYIELNKVQYIERLMEARKNVAYGEQRDYFDDHHCIGWTRIGNLEKEYSGCAVLMTNGDAATKRMSMGPDNAGRIFIDLCGKQEEKITLDENGEADFTVGPGSVAVWVDERYPIENDL
jgi:alpha-amylase